MALTVWAQYVLCFITPFPFSGHTLQLGWGNTSEFQPVRWRQKSYKPLPGLDHKTFLLSFQLSLLWQWPWRPNAAVGIATGWRRAAQFLPCYAWWEVDCNWANPMIFGGLFVILSECGLYWSVEIPQVPSHSQWFAAGRAQENIWMLSLVSQCH